VIWVGFVYDLLACGFVDCAASLNTLRRWQEEKYVSSAEMGEQFAAGSQIISL
jgi:hypothetical protein